MACQFATMRLAVPGAPSTAVMTGNLTNSVLSLLELVEPGRPLIPTDAVRLRKAATLVIAFCAGCVAGALAILLLKQWSWTVPLMLSGAAVAIAPGSCSNGAEPRPTPTLVTLRHPAAE